MPIKVMMPSLGESVVEGTLTKWLKAEGEAVSENDPLVEVNTDKVDSEIPSPGSGTLLKILVPEGTVVQAGTTLALIGEPGEAAADNAQPAPAAKAEPAAPEPAAPEPLGVPGAEAAPATAAVPPPGRNRDLGFISPVVSKMAHEYGIDLTQVRGTGQGGRITKKDVEAYLASRPAEPAAAPAAERKPAPAAGAATPAPAPPPPAAPASAGTPGEVLPLTPVRKAIAEHMVYSKHTSPHVTTVMEADLSQVVAHRDANKAAYGRDGINLTYTAYLIAAIVTALKAYPIVNSSWSDEGIVLHKEINIGMATSLGEGGLIVPVIKDADSLSLLGLARAINDLANRARARQLKPDEVKGGTFTLTNHGTSGSLFASPIINQPQCAILGAGAIQKRVVVINDAIAIRPMVYVSLTFDHRILDGAIADYFLGKVVESLQGWA